MFLFERYLFVISATDELHSFDILDDPSQRSKSLGHVSDVIKIRNFVHFYRQSQPDVTHPCSTNNGGCEQFCLVSYANSTDQKMKLITTGQPIAKCACEEGYKLSENGRCIVANESDGPLLIFGRTSPGSISALTLSSISSNNFPPIENGSNSENSRLFATPQVFDQC
ncbi:hypothetical protein AB6A40_010620 [Gnathostoma spinigerum]|uniref:Uncharacterized protein n=1 Tax=Gnathostoma spinigerum TaxID=75299 RepID=A0ABD6EX36_9BILA